MHFIKKKSTSKTLLLIYLETHIDKLIELNLSYRGVISYLTSTTDFKNNEIYEYLKNNKKV